MNTCDHIELSTDDPRKAREFYAKVFGWKIESTPVPGGGDYLMFRSSERAGGGITGKQMPGQPTAWLPYISVPSVKAAVATAKAAGGHAIVEYMPIGEMGAIGVIADPTGGHIGLWEPGKAAAAPKKADAKKAEAKKADAKRAKKADKKAAKAKKKAAKPSKKAAKPSKKVAKAPKAAKKAAKKAKKAVKKKR